MQLQDRPLQQPPKTYSPEEYLALEETAETRSEYRNGQIIPMAGGTPEHNQITLNIAGYLDLTLSETTRVFASDMRLWIPATQTHTYPDVMVITDDLQLLAGRNDTVTNPSLIIEVLSDSTADYDRGAKFRAYRSIPSFREYLLIEQDTLHLEHFAQNDSGQWVLTDYEDITQSVVLKTTNCELPLATVYRKVNLEAAS